MAQIERSRRVTRHKIYKLFRLMLIVALTSGLAHAVSADPSPSEDYWMIFASTRDSSKHLYRMRPDGSDVQAITTSAESINFVEFQSLSPDNNWIIFRTVGRDPTQDLYRIQVDGSGLQRLTTDYHNTQVEGWSSDGEWLIFSAEYDGDVDIFRIWPDGTDLQNLTNNDARDEFNTILPDEERIIFTSHDGDRSSMYQVDLDGRNLVGLASDLNSSFMDISPDNEWIYFTGQDTNDEIMLYRIRVDGTERQQLNNTSESHFIITWTPDAERIIVGRQVGAYISIASMLPDGSDVRPIAPAPSIFTTFSPDGAWLYYEHDASECCRIQLATGDTICSDSEPTGFATWSPDGEWMVLLNGAGLYLMQPDTSEVIQLSDAEGLFDRFQAWSPDGEWLIFRDFARLGLYRVKLDGSEPQKLTDEGVQNDFVTWYIPHKDDQ